MHTQRPITSELILWSNLLPGPHQSYHKTTLGEQPVNCRSSLPFPLTQSQGIKVLVYGKSQRSLQTLGIAATAPWLVPVHVFFICLFIGKEWMAQRSGPGCLWEASE